MINEEIVILAILKKFSGKVVTDYPCKGQKIPQSKNDFGNGGKPQNPSLVSEQ